MADSTIILNAGSGGDALDAEQIGSVKRERMEVAGAALAEIARVIATAPAGTEYALVVRPIPSGTQAVSGPLTDAQLRAAVVPVGDGGGSLTVDGTVTANLGTIDGVATETTLAAILTELGAKLEAGQAVALDAASLAALETISAAQSGAWTVTANAGSGTFSVSGPLTDTQLRATAVPVSGTFWQATQPVSGSVTANPTRPATPAQSSVAASASSVSLLAANASRLGATVYNDSASATLYVKLGTTASTTSFTVALPPQVDGIGGYYEVPFGYTGAVDGIWSAAVGSARITELT